MVFSQILQELLSTAIPFHPYLFKGDTITIGLFHDNLYFNQMGTKFTIQICVVNSLWGKTDNMNLKVSSGKVGSGVLRDTSANELF